MCSVKTLKFGLESFVFFNSLCLFRMKICTKRGPIFEKGSKLFHVCLFIIMTKSFEFVMKLEVKNTSVLNDQKKIKYNCKDRPCG
jgi:hypothetical protein